MHKCPHHCTNQNQATISMSGQFDKKQRKNSKEARTLKSTANNTMESKWILTEAKDRKIYEDKPALFLDRDGVIIKEKHYLSDPNKVELYTGAKKLIKAYKENKQAVIIDYKTGKNPQYADVNQLELMTLAVFKHFPEVENVKAGLYFFTKTQLIKETYDKTKEPDLWAKWLEQVNELKSCYDNDVWNPKPNFSCSRFCPVESCEHNGRY